ncbi:MAG: endonuclease [Pseudomonadota bacterium]
MDFADVYNILYEHHGPQYWWPGETPFEVMVGAVLTQNTAWSNVERAIANLKQADALSAQAIINAAPRRLAHWLKPSGYFNVKARRLRNFCRWYAEQGGFEALARLETSALRHALLGVNGVGPETADDILLYAFARPVFVIDAYTRRLFTRLGLIEGAEGYEALRARFENALTIKGKRRLKLFNEYHALIVKHGKDVCRARPLCARCCLARHCPAKRIVA